MDWKILLIETIMLTIIFNSIVFISLYRNPIWWVHDYPEDIQEVYFKNHERKPTQPMSKKVLLKKGTAILMALVILTTIVWMAQARTFWEGFLGSYFIWFIISAWDCFFMDWVLFANIKAIRLPDTEHMDQAYHQKKYHFVRGLIGLIIGLVPCVLTAFIIGCIGH